MFNVMRSQDYLNKRGGDTSDLEFSTLSIAITGVRSGVDILARLLDESSQDIIGDMVEPLETYYKNYDSDSQESISRSLTIWNQYLDATKQREEARGSFFGLKEMAIEQEKAIEDAMIQHEHGNITTEKV
mmetsp:Transcript_20660/g.27877  ORF Transcript_20660/g.27877 Transcript_20660/m.27877 type:complete len:130 (-) Transcript_20660:2841-3230(-)